VTRSLTLALLLGCIACTEAGVLEEVRASGVLRIGTTFDYRPFSYREDGALAGIDVDLGLALAAALGVRAEWVVTSWPTLLDDLAAGAFDVAMSGISVTPERARHGLFGRPYLRTGKSVLARCVVSSRFRTLADIDRPDVRVIVNPGGTNAAFVDRHLEIAEIVRHPDNVGIFEALEAGAADLMITDAIEAEIESARHPGLCHDLEPPWLEPVDKAWLLPRDLVWQATLDTWLTETEASGALAAIVSRHSARRGEPLLE
jgi:ABC-type amino acid transport substrate-binding protein